MGNHSKDMESAKLFPEGNETDMNMEKDEEKTEIKNEKGIMLEDNIENSDLELPSSVKLFPVGNEGDMNMEMDEEKSKIKNEKEIMFEDNVETNNLPLSSKLSALVRKAQVEGTKEIGHGKKEEIGCTKTGKKRKHEDDENIRDKKIRKDKKI